MKKVQVIFVFQGDKQEKQLQFSKEFLIAF